MGYHHKYRKYKKKYLKLKQQYGGNKESVTPLLKTFPLFSPAFKNSETIPKKYTADGINISPPLKWNINDVPKGTKYYMLVIDDPDAPDGKFIHWIMWNIPKKLTEIEEDFEPTEGIEVGANSFGKSKYGGPSPPPGNPHRYHFYLYALDSKLDIPKEDYKYISTRYTDYMRNKILGVGKLIGVYKR